MSGSKGNRQTWMDLVRGAAVVLVVLFHATPEEPVAAAGQGVATVINSALMPFRMPALLLLSGLLLEHSLSKGSRAYLTGKLRAIVWPWILWSALMVALLPHEFTQDPVAFLAIGTHLWFLGVLICCYALALVVRHVLLVPAPWAVAAIVLFGLAGLTQSPDRLILPDYLWYSGFFFAGAAVRPGIARWQATRGLWPALLGAVAVVGAVLQVSRGHEIPYRVDQVAISLAGVMALVWVAPRIPRSLPVRVVEWFGRDSIVTYLAHYPMVVLLGVGVTATQPALHPPVFVAFLLVLGLSAAMTWARRYTPWLYRMPWKRRVPAPPEPLPVG